MPTADAVREKALSLADTGIPTEEDVRELLDYCMDRRVSVVLARQQLLRDLEERPSDDRLRRAAELLEHVLERLRAE
jgi:hypothetical protein